MKQRLRHALGCLVLCALLMGGTAPAASAAQFQDVPASHPAAEAIRRCVELGFFSGETANRFGVGHSMTRGAFVVAASRFFEWDTSVTPPQPTYSDVSPDAWCYRAVEAAVASGALTSQSDTFRPGDAITREELAVLLVRALGYEDIAGLAQDLPTPFRDVRTNPGYIAIAYDFGLVRSSSRTAFSPNQPAAREDVAVILMNLYDRLHAPAARSLGIATSVEGLPDLSGYDAVGIPAGKLMCSGKPAVVPTMDAQETAALQAAIRQQNCKSFLYLPGGPTALNGPVEETVKVVLAAVDNGGYDGLFLDLGELKLSQEQAMTQFIRALKPALGNTLLYVVAEAPAWDGRTYDGYDYGLIGEIADCLVLRAASHKGITNNFPTAPLSPPEEVYYAFGELSGTVDSGKLALMIPTAGTLYLNGREENDALSRAEIQALLEGEDTRCYRSGRYACSYLTTVVDKETAVAWYLDDSGIDARAKLAGLFGVPRLCISDLNNLPTEPPEA